MNNCMDRLICFYNFVDLIGLSLYLRTPITRSVDNIKAKETHLFKIIFQIWNDDCYSPTEFFLVRIWNTKRHKRLMKRFRLNRSTNIDHKMFWKFHFNVGKYKDNFLLLNLILYWSLIHGLKVILVSLCTRLVVNREILKCPKQESVQLPSRILSCPRNTALRYLRSRIN
jgi:hypothetical protein